LIDDNTLKEYVMEISKRKKAASERLERINEVSAAIRKEAQERETYERLRGIYGEK
jgi:hypothetical protein